MASLDASASVGRSRLLGHAGAKRKARMALVDDMVATRATRTKGAPADDVKPARPTKSRCVD